MKTKKKKTTIKFANDKVALSFMTTLVWNDASFSYSHEDSTVTFVNDFSWRLLEIFMEDNWEDMKIVKR